MDLYQVVELLGKEHTRTEHINTNALLRNHGVKPIRRNCYDPAQIETFKQLYDSGAYDRRHAPRKKGKK